MYVVSDRNEQKSEIASSVEWVRFKDTRLRVFRAAGRDLYQCASCSLLVPRVEQGEVGVLAGHLDCNGIES